jgi:hypothetical protein
MENHAKYGENIYYANDQEIFVSQFIASELNWKDKSVKLTQRTNYPVEQGTTLSFECKEPVKMNLLVRYPWWATGGMEIKVNGRKVATENKPSSFVSIYRNWKTGDKVEVKFPFSLRTEPMPDDSSRIAIFYGPLVLAGELGALDNPEAASPMFVPVIMSESRNPADWLVPVAGKPNTFRMNGVGKPKDVELKPFYDTHDIRYTIFWDLFTQATWDQRQTDYQKELARKAAVEARTIDFVQPGEMQPERDHNFKGEKTTPGEFQDRKNRESRSGWFSFDMKVTPDAPVVLLVEYWGGFPGNKTFNILVNDQVIGTENISNIRDGQWIDIEYPVPSSYTLGKSKITVKFSAYYGHMA